jgi:hypothetical protein
MKTAILSIVIAMMVGCIIQPRPDEEPKEEEFDCYEHYNNPCDVIVL